MKPFHEFLKDQFLFSEEFLSEGKVEFHDLRPTKKNSKAVFTRHHSGDHVIQVEYTHRSEFGKNEEEHHPDEGHYNVDFYTNHKFRGTGNDIPSNHKTELMRHLGNSIHGFIIGHKPKSVKMEAALADGDELHAKKKQQYKQAGKMIAAKYNGKFHHTPHGSMVSF